MLLNHAPKKRRPQKAINQEFYFFEGNDFGMKQGIVILQTPKYV